MKQLTEQDYEDYYKKLLPYINYIVEISQKYLGDGVEIQLRFDTDGTFCFMPPYPEPMLVRDEDAEFPRFVDKNDGRHQLMRQDGKIKWVRKEKT